MTTDISIVIPNYNGEHLLPKHLPKVISAKEYKKNKILEVIIVDDASKDNSAKLIKENFKDVKLIQHKINRGFSASVNTGVRSSKGDFIVLLNTDVSPDKDFLQSVLPHFKDDSVFAVSFQEKGYGWAKGKFENGFIVHEPGSETKDVHESFWASGGSAIFRRSQWISLGGLDEKLFKFYWEDVDLAYRAQKRGLKILWEPKSHVTHNHESVTSVTFGRNTLQKMKEKNHLLFIWKNLTSPNLFRKHLLGLVGRISRNPGYLLVVASSLTKIRQILKARNREKKEGKISDEAIFAKFS